MNTDLSYVLKHWLSDGHPKLLAFDYDGTLAPPVDDPSGKTFLAKDQEILRILSTIPRYRTAVVSGRGFPLLQELVGIHSRMIYAGNHGYEIEGEGFEFCHPGARAAVGALKECMTRLKQELQGTEGLIFEEKIYSGALFFKHSSDSSLQRIAPTAEAVIDQYPSLCYVRGSRVYEICPRIEWHKGYALAWLSNKLAIPEKDILFVGDDTNDEPAFRHLPGMLSIRVGTAQTSAHYRLSSQKAVTTLIRNLIQWEK